jgi:hypothetical protein
MAQANHQGNRGMDYGVSRSIRTGAVVLSEDVLRAVENQLPGDVRLICGHHASLRVAYDAALVSFSQILGRLEQAGIRPVDSRWFRIKAACTTLLTQMLPCRLKHGPSPAATGFRDYEHVLPRSRTRHLANDEIYIMRSMHHETPIY